MQSQAACTFNINTYQMALSAIQKRLKQLREYSTPGHYFWRLCAFFSKNKATLDKVSYESGHKCYKELKNHSFTSVELIAVKLQ